MTPRRTEPTLDAQEAGHDDALVVDGEVVSVTTTFSDVPFVDPTARTTIEAVRPSAVAVATRTAAVVTTGFVAGALATAVVARKAGVVRRRTGRASGRTQRFLVEVQALGDR